MTLFLQTCAAVLLAVVLTLTVGSRSKEMAVLLGLAVCCMASLIAMNYLEPVMTFLDVLESSGKLDGDMVQTLLKAAGIGILTEISCLVCTDAGNASMGKSVQLLGTSVILWLSIPLFSTLLELIQTILGEI